MNLSTLMATDGVLMLDSAAATLADAAVSLLTPPGKLYLRREVVPTDRDDVKVGISFPLQQEGGGRC